MNSDEERAMAAAALHTFRTGRVTVANRDDEGVWHIDTGDSKITLDPRPVPPRRPWWKFWGR